jgi:20S proteasome alpha/beta subunit
MTLISGLRCGEGVVLGADSQVTVEGLRTHGTKLFCSPQGIVWGTAGPIAAAQAIESQFEKSSLGRNPSKESSRLAIREVMKAAAEEMTDSEGRLAGGRFAGLFAWRSTEDGDNLLLKAFSDGTVEFQPEYGSVGSNADIARIAFFGFTSSGFLEYETLPLEAAKMLVHKVTDDTVIATPASVDGPVQLAVVSAAGSVVLKEEDLQPVRDTASAFRMHQADFLKRVEPSADEKDEVTGLIPD